MQDVAMMREVGYCPGIENYSRILAGKKVGEAPETLLSYFPHDHKGNPEFLTVIDESHVTLPQLHGMYAGDRARKENLIKFGFRLPSALDNRPLQYNEFEERVGDMLFVSATPGKFELAESNKVVEQIIRPTGLIDPVLEVKPVLPKKASPLTPLQGRGEEVQTHRTADLKHYDGLKLKVKEMRQNPTKAEELLWKHLRGDKFDIRFRRQIIIDNFIVDFVNLEKKLIIEVDGGIHDKQKERDEARTQILENLGYKVLRFNNSEVLDDLQNVLEKIKLELVPLSNGEGPGVRLSKEEVNYPGQIADFIMETEKAVKKGGRVIATTLTKKMAEDLSQFLRDRKIKAEYLHSDIKTIDRIQILTKFRRGEFDCLVGVNLLREGLDLPEVSLIGILDADKEGFLRSETSLIQTIGRAARNVDGKVILYADVMTGSLERAISETNRRRKLQQEHNQKHGITPKTIIKSINDITAGIETIKKKTAHEEAMLEMKLSGKKVSTLLKQKEKEMLVAAKELDFETAAILRDEIKELEKMLEASKDKSDK
jgi:excinuclease UvrABC helicase subunit UvrB/very-short-patch-repair endonuclease